MMALGDYRFCLDTSVYQELKHSQSYRWQGQARLLRGLAQQFIGLGDETLAFSGVIYPHYRGGVKQLEKLCAQAGQGEPLLLVDGLGFVWGLWVVTNIEEIQSYFASTGQALKQTFSMQLTSYGEDKQ